MLARLRASCLALPENRRAASRSPAFDVAGKMFCYFWHDHHGDGLTAACVKVTGRDRLDLLIEAGPALYSWLPYLSPGGSWIRLCLADRTSTGAHVEAPAVELAPGRAEASGGHLKYARMCIFRP